MPESLRHTAVFLLLTVLFAGCSLVDEDLSDCQNSLGLDYQLRLETNITTELQTQLGLVSQLEIQGVLKDHLSGIFSDYARDVDLSFYDVVDPMERLTHMTEVMNGSESSYALFLPVRSYMHTAVANIQANTSVSLQGDDYYHQGRLVQHSGTDGVVQPHNTGLFTARQHLDVKAGVDQQFDVHLYMANCATALVLNRSEAPSVQSIKVYVEGMATGFQIADSTYVFEGNPMVASQELKTEDEMTSCFASIHFPSRDEPESKVVIEVTDPEPEYFSNTVWNWKVYVTNQDGSITESVLHMHQRLPAGFLKVLNVTVRESGEVETTDSTVGVSVTLDWTPGLDFPVTI